MTFTRSAMAALFGALSRHGRIATLGIALVSVSAPALIAAVPGSAAAEEARPIAGSAAGAYLASRIAQDRYDMASAARYTAQVLARNPDNPILQERAFRLHLAAGDIDAALELAPDILDSRPNGLIARVLLAGREVHQEQYDVALSNLARAGGDGVGQYIIPLLTGWALVGAGDAEAAVAAVEPMLDMVGMSGAAQLHIGLILDYAGDGPGARAALEAALSEGGNYLLIKALGRLYEREGENENALALYDRFNAGDGERALLAGEAQRARGDDAPSGPLFEHPSQGMAVAVVDLAGLWRRETETTLALIYAQLARYLSPELERADILVADILATSGRYAEALAVYREVPEDSVFSWTARLSESRMLEEDGNAEAAVDLLRRLASERPSATAPLVQIGDIERSQSNFAEAVDAYDRAFDRDSDAVSQDWSFLYKRGIALERAKLWDRAEKDLLHAIELRPDYAHLLNYLGYSYIDRGEMVEESERLIRKAIELKPEDGFIMDSLGWVYYRTARFDEAVELLEQAVALEPVDPTINDHLGDAYWMVGRRTEARFQWARALDGAAQDAELRASLQDKLSNGLTKHDVLAEFADKITAPPLR